MARSRQDRMPAVPGDEESFAGLVEPYRRELFAHCYRMLGTLHDAEDALLRAWRGLPGFDGRSSLRHWLHRIASNASLDVAARRARAPVLPADHAPPARDGWPADATPVTGGVL